MHLTVANIKPIFYRVVWKSNKLLALSHSGEQHILWRTLCICVKEICYAGFTVWAHFRTMRATEGDARFLWRQ